MRQRRGTIWTERALMVLFLASLAGALNLVMAVHRRAAATRSEAEAVSTPSVQVDTDNHSLVRGSETAVVRGIVASAE